MFIIASNADAPAPETGFMGIAYTIQTQIPPIEGHPWIHSGVLVSNVLDDTPAERAGLQETDIIVAIENVLFDDDSEEVEAIFQSVLEQCQPGDTISLKIIRTVINKYLTANEQEYDPDTFLNAPRSLIRRLHGDVQLKLEVNQYRIVKDVTLILGRRTDGQLPAPPEIYETDLDGVFHRPEWEKWVNELVDQYGIEAEYEDLRQRLKNLHGSDDGFRLPLISAIHRDPFITEAAATLLSEAFLQASHLSDLDLSEILLYKTGKKQVWEPVKHQKLDTSTDKEGFRSWFINNMTPLVNDLMAVYDVFSDDEKQFILEHRFGVLDAFSNHIYLDRDEDTDRYQNNRTLIELGGRIDLAVLYEASDALLHFALSTYREVFAWTENNPEVRTLDTPWGKIGFGTPGNDWWRNSDIQFIYDPAGDDLYTDGAGVASCFDRPVAWIFDLEGDDAYQSTATYGAQGSAMPGFALLYDKSGNDTYIGQRLSQGTGYMGIGILYDHQGDDRYYGSEFVQGFGLFGLGLLIDNSGNDYYHANLHAQGVGLTHGLGVLYDGGGDDRGFATGNFPTTYGDPGIFEAWSQGVGMGFRNIASGGIGMMVTGGGNNHWESGNFGQGGGYYYGLGVFRAGGAGNDTYIGSRYAQGFSAHQAIGAFIEDGGDDRYLTRHMASIGLAWDESVSLFIDRGGNDYYDGGSSFSIGASAHNSFAIFIDQGGEDTFIHNAGPGRAGGNSYHGGHSFSLFVSQGEEKNHYSSDRVENDVEMFWPDFGFFRDGKAIPQVDDAPEEKEQESPDEG